MKTRQRWIALGVCGAMLVGMATLPRISNGSEEGRRNTTYALGAASLYLLSKKKTTLGVVGLGATAYSAGQLQNKINDRHRKEQQTAVNRASQPRRAAAAPAPSKAQVARSLSKDELANLPAVQELISSAYKKGMDAGYQNGYSEGKTVAYSARAAGAVKTQPAAAPAPASGGSTYERILLAMKE